MEIVGATLQGKRYMEEKILQRKDDPLKWWKGHDKHYTLLSTLALKYLSIPGTYLYQVLLFHRSVFFQRQGNWFLPKGIE